MGEEAGTGTPVSDSDAGHPGEPVPGPQGVDASITPTGLPSLTPDPKSSALPCPCIPARRWL